MSGKNVTLNPWARTFHLDGWTWTAGDKVRHVLGAKGRVLGGDVRNGLLVEWGDGTVTWTAPENVRKLKEGK